MKKSDRRRIRVRFAILAVLLLIGILLDINAGYSGAGLQDLFAGNPILVQFRLPRVLVSLLVGIALSLSGSIMQSVTGNDMAEPGLLGINAGAGLFIALFIFLFRQGSPAFTLMLPLLAFAGSVLTFFTEYRLASSRGRVHPKRLLLMGVAISIALTSLTTVIMLALLYNGRLEIWKHLGSGLERRAPADGRSAAPVSVCVLQKPDPQRADART